VRGLSVNKFITSVGYLTLRENKVELLTTKLYNLHIISVEKFHKKSVCQKIGGVHPIFGMLVHLDPNNVKFESQGHRSNRMVRTKGVHFGRPFVKRFALCYWTIVCPVYPVCDVGVSWLNGWMDLDATWYADRPRPWQYCVRWKPSFPLKRGTPPLFGSCLL